MSLYPDYRNVPARCDHCLHVIRRTVGDSFDRAVEYSCGHPHGGERLIDSYAEHGKLENPPPRWCPLIVMREVDESETD